MALENWITTSRRMKDPYLTPLTEINSKLTNDLNVRPETIKLPDQNIGEKQLDIDLSRGFLDMTSKTQATKAKIYKSVYINLKSCTV